MARPETKEFFKVLHEELKFEDANKISSTKVRRLSEDEPTSIFLTDFVANVNQEKIVTPQQLKIFHGLLKHGDIKGGAELERCITKTEALNAAYEVRKIELDQKIDKSTLRKKKLEYELMRMEKLKLQQQRLDRIKALATESTCSLRDKKNEAQTLNDQISKTITDLTLKFQDLCNIFENADERCYLLSQVDLWNLLQAEERYNLQLTSFVKKQFSDVSQSIASNSNESESTHEIRLLNDENLLSGENEQTRKKIAADIRRAEHWYPDREKRLISVQARESSAEAVLSFLKEKQANISAKTVTSSADEHRRSLERAKKRSNETRQIIRQFSDEKIPHLISKGTPLQSTHLVTGDYRKKLLHQEYMIEKQKKLISLLQQQKNRLDLLWMLLAVEEADHEKAGKQIPAFLNTLKSILDQSVTETEWFTANQENKEDSTPRSVFDDHDKVPLASYKILVRKSNEGAGDFPLFCPFDSLPLAAETVSKHLDTVRKHIVTSPNPDEISLNELLNSMSTCQNQIQNEGMTDNSQREFSHLSALMLNSSKEMDEKKNFLEYHKRVATARTVGTDFYLQPRKPLIAENLS